MKKITTLIAALIISCSAFAQGIEFEHGTFDEALAKAKEENKMLFMDCYTTWCGPCKWLSKEIFPQEEVGTYFNENFVSIKMDMEKGEGIELGKRYGVQAFPTLLFIQPDGKEVYRIVGGKQADELIASAKNALNPDMRLDVLAKKYNEGERELAFVLKYINALNEAYDQETATKISKELVASLPLEKFNTKEMFNVLASSDIQYNSKEFNYVVKNKEQLLTVVNPMMFNQVMISAVAKHLKHKAETVATLDELHAEIESSDKVYKIEDEQYRAYLIKNFTNTFYLAQKDYDKWFEVKMADVEKEKGTERYFYVLHSVGDEVLRNPAFEGSEESVAKVYEIAKGMVADKDGIIMGNLLLAKVYLRMKDKEKAMNCFNIFFEENGKAGGNNTHPSVGNLKTAIESL